MEPALSTTELGATPRTTLKRSPDRAVLDRHAAYRLLDSQTVAHVGVCDDDQPFVLPMAYARDGERLLLHGSRASRIMKLLADGRPCCVTVTALDAIVVARSGYESSMNYRSVMVIGKGRETGADEVASAIDAVVDGLIPDRSLEVRETKPKELAATMFVEVPLDEMSMKERTGPPQEDDQDHLLPIWGGVVPILTTFGQPVADEFSVAQKLPLPKSVTRLIG